MGVCRALDRGEETGQTGTLRRVNRKQSGPPYAERGKRARTLDESTS